LLLSFVTFQVKPSKFNGISKRSAVILEFRISQDNVATQLRWGGRPCNSYVKLPQESDSERILKVYICRSYDQKSSSSANVHIPSTNLHSGSRSFHVAAPTVWNSLPSTLPW